MLSGGDPQVSYFAYDTLRRLEPTILSHHTDAIALLRENQPDEDED